MFVCYRTEQTPKFPVCASKYFSASLNADLTGRCVLSEPTLNSSPIPMPSRSLLSLPECWPDWKARRYWTHTKLLHCSKGVEGHLSFSLNADLTGRHVVTDHTLNSSTVPRASRSLLSLFECWPDWKARRYWTHSKLLYCSKGVEVTSQPPWMLTWLEGASLLNPQ